MLEEMYYKKLKDVSNVFICVYNDNHVGLFKRLHWSTKIGAILSSRYETGIIYEGVDSDYIGIKETHYRNFDKNEWKPIGTKIVVDSKGYVVNCVIQNEMSFDDMRLIMYADGKIEPYEIGKASSQEMIDVLKYALGYYQLDQNIPIRRKK